MCDNVPASTVIVAWLWAHLRSPNNPNNNVPEIIETYNPCILRFHITYQRAAPFCLLMTTRFKTVAPLFFLWDAQVHKY